MGIDDGKMRSGKVHHSGSCFSSLQRRGLDSGTSWCRPYRTESARSSNTVNIVGYLELQNFVTEFRLSGIVTTGSKFSSRLNAPLQTALSGRLAPLCHCLFSLSFQPKEVVIKLVSQGRDRKDADFSSCKVQVLPENLLALQDFTLVFDSFLGGSIPCRTSVHVVHLRHDVFGRALSRFSATILSTSLT